MKNLFMFFRSYRGFTGLQARWTWALRGWILCQKGYSKYHIWRASTWAAITSRLATFFHTAMFNNNNFVSFADHQLVHLTDFQDFNSDATSTQYPSVTSTGPGSLDNISRLESLQQLNLASNRLQKLPQALTSLKTLGRIDLSFNDLAELQPDLSNLNRCANLIPHKYIIEIMSRYVKYPCWIKEHHCCT